jgi:hypothetical protein
MVHFTLFFSSIDRQWLDTTPYQTPYGKRGHLPPCHSSLCCPLISSDTLCAHERTNCISLYAKANRVTNEPWITIPQTQKNYDQFPAQRSPCSRAFLDSLPPGMAAVEVSSVRRRLLLTPFLWAEVTARWRCFAADRWNDEATGLVIGSICFAWGWWANWMVLLDARACLDPKYFPNSTVQKEYFPSHQNVGTYMEY